MKTAILHVGTEKTGTTTIQQFLSINRSELSEQGVKIPSFLEKLNHQWLPNLFQDDSFDESFFERLGIDGKANIESCVLTKKEELYQAVQSCRSRKWIFSSEHLQSTLNENSIQSLSRYLYNLFESVQILIYIRNPIDLAISRWSTQLKCGSLMKHLPRPSNHRIKKICD